MVSVLVTVPIVGAPGLVTATAGAATAGAAAAGVSATTEAAGAAGVPGHALAPAT